MLVMSIVGMYSSCGVKKVGVRNIPSKELSANASFGIGTLLIVEQSSIENRPRGVRYIRTVVYTVEGMAK